MSKLDRAEAGKSRKNGRITIYDVAQFAGVSPSTASRALHKPGRLSAATEQRIVRAAEELGYRANPAARALPSGRTRTLALLVADITNPVVFGTIRGAESAAERAGYTLVISEFWEDAELEMTKLDQLIPSVDGIILGSTRTRGDGLVATAVKVPTVLINSQIEGLQSVVSDSTVAVTELLEHLRQNGHAHVAYLEGPPYSWANQRRWEIISSAAEKLGIKLSKLGPFSPQQDGGRAALPQVRESGASAVIAYNDVMAIGLMQEAQNQGFEIPADLSIAGFDNIFGSDFTTPSLTTIQAKSSEMGEAAVQLILQKLDGEEFTDFAPFPSTLVIRNSVGPASNQ